jgi:hypothetical protein
MSKYERLSAFLGKQTRDRVELSFKDVERILGFKLPRSALEHRPWWANSGGSHVQSKAWLEAGFETETVDMDARRLVFRRKADARAPAPRKRTFADVYGCLAGTIQIHGDVTGPASDDWPQ